MFMEVAIVKYYAGKNELHKIVHDMTNAYQITWLLHSKNNREGKGIKSIRG